MRYDLESDTGRNSSKGIECSDRELSGTHAYTHTYTHVHAKAYKLALILWQFFTISIEKFLHITRARESLHTDFIEPAAGPRGAPTSNLIQGRPT